MMNRPILQIVLCLSLTALLVSSVTAGEISSDIPFKPDAAEKYLFYQHSKLMEAQGLPARHKKYGDYAFIDILNSLKLEGFNVIAEWRPKDAKLHPYAFRIARKVKGLMDKGVPASHITVAGVDKGGKIALLVASYVGEPSVNYVILGGCSSDQDKAERFMEDFELIPAGRILSIHNEEHRKSGSCAPYLAEAEAGTLYEERILSANQGQALFYRPDRRWIESIRNWSESEATH